MDLRQQLIHRASILLADASHAQEPYDFVDWEHSNAHAKREWRALVTPIIDEILANYNITPTN